MLLTSSQNFRQCLHAYDQQQEIPIGLLQRSPSLLIMTKKKNKCQFLLTFTQLSIWNNNFLGNGFAPTTCSSAFNAFKHHELPCISCSKNSFCSSWLNNLCDSRTCSFSKVCNKRKRDPIMKLRSLGHNSFEYWSNVKHHHAHEQSFQSTLLAIEPSQQPFYFSLAALVKQSLNDPSYHEWYTKIPHLIEWTWLSNCGKDFYMTFDACYAFSISIHAPWHYHCFFQL